MRFRTVALAAAVAVLLAASAGPAAAQRIPAPEEVLGFEVGADYRLATYEQAIAYIKALEEASPMLRTFEVGQTSMGRPMIYAVISSAENMARLDRYKEISRRLSLVRGVSDAEARKLAAEGRAIVYIDGGLHASECAPAQQVIQLAHDIVASDDAATRLIRENTILVLVLANPDGMNLLAEWYHGNVGTPYEVGPMPWVYNKYVGHDNNRDSYMLNMPETQHLTKIVNEEWFPQVLLNQHQRGPFPTRIFVPPHTEPTNPNVHPMVVRYQNLIGTAMATQFEREGKPGVVSGFRYDSWYPGYVTQVVDSHNIVSLLTETNLFHYATPHYYTVDTFPEEYRDFTVSAFYPNPWKGGWWRLRDAVEYSLTASKSVLHTAAKFREALLYDKYKMGVDVMARFEKEPPYAWIIPADQRDAGTTVELLRKMQMLGIEISRAESAFVSDGVSYPAGTWVIPMSQPFALFVKNVFEEQVYPDLTKYPAAWQGLVSPQKFENAYLPPYDMAGWTLPLQMGVKVVPAHTPLKASLAPVKEVSAPGKVAGQAGHAYLLPAGSNNSFLAVNRLLAAGTQVSRAREAFEAGGEKHAPGTFIVPAGGVSRSSMESLAGDLSLNIIGAPRPISAPAFRLRSPRVALYKSWTASMDEGWTRWLLEQFEFPYTNVYDAEVRSGGLRANYDVLVIPSMSIDALVEGHKPGIVASKYAGGITEAGVRNIRSFVEEGGTLVLLNHSTAFGIEKLKLPVTNVLKELTAPGRGDGGAAKPVEFACPGSVLRMEFDPKHPVAYGMPEEAPAMFINSPAFHFPAWPGTTKEQEALTIAKYPAEGLLMSGFLRGEKHIQKRVSALDVPLGKGRVILLGFAVQQRGQPHGTFKLLFNSLYYGAGTDGAGVGSKD
jgi:hypothetical protein